MTAELSIRADLLALRLIEPWLGEVLAAQLGEDSAEDVTGRAMLAVQELCVNVIEHGGLGGDDSIAIAVDCDDTDVKIELLDGGPAFDPDSIAEPNPLEPQIGGYGLLIVRKLSTRFEVTRDSDMNRTVLSIPVHERR